MISEWQAFSHGYVCVARVWGGGIFFVFLQTMTCLYTGYFLFFRLPRQHDNDKAAKSYKNSCKWHSPSAHRPANYVNVYDWKNWRLLINSLHQMRMWVCLNKRVCRCMYALTSHTCSWVFSNTFLPLMITTYSLVWKLLELVDKYS